VPGEKSSIRRRKRERIVADVKFSGMHRGVGGGQHLWGPSRSVKRFKLTALRTERPSSKVRTSFTRETVSRILASSEADMSREKWLGLEKVSKFSVLTQASGGRVFFWEPRVRKIEREGGMAARGEAT